MKENNEGKKKSNDENSIYQSFSKNIIFTSNNENVLRTNNKEQLMDFSFKKKYEIINDLTSTIKNSKFNLLNIYSKDDKNIVKSGHFAKIRQTKHKKKMKEFIKPDTNYLIKTLFVDSSNSKNNSNKNNKIQSINNNNKENENNNFFHTVGVGEDNLFEKVKTKTKYILPNKKDKNLNLNKTKPLLNKKLLTEIHNFKNSSKTKKTRNINNNINNAESKKNAFDSCKESNKENIKYKKINHEIKNNKIQNSKKIIKISKNRIFFSSHTNSIFNTKNMNLSNTFNNYNSNTFKRESSSNKNIKNTSNNSNNTSFLNKTLDINFNEKKISDSLYKKIDIINKRLILFSEYNKKLTKQIKDLNEEISSFENSKNNSKKIIQSDRRNISYKLLSNSPKHNKNNSSNFNSDIKNILLKRKIKNIKINYVKNKNKACLNQSLKEHHCYVDSLNIISEFNIKSNKKNTNANNSKNKNNSNFRNENSSKNKNDNSKNKENSKNKDITKGRNKIDRKKFKKRRINSNNVSEYIHIKKVLPI
jgi:hypothetical protein